ncbi:Methylated-DNA--protein-cysteine methyltransferase (fragment) [Crenothrix polyspora]|uniref:Methylated-DNA--protein-cysteine methyltransferase n=1 Tax=Crenothrix polyspora TaxID=360316 RepID=A0A1R4HIZ6_9GAMM
MSLYVYQTQLGRIGIEEQHDSITEVYFDNEPLPESVDIMATALTDEAARQLNAYLVGTLKTFSLPLAPSGTVFQKKVWHTLCDIPYGQTASYKDIAIAADNPKAVRAVGQANNKNPIPIFIPCHRVIGADGKLVGYSGGLAIKECLLMIERQNTP